MKFCQLSGTDELKGPVLGKLDTERQAPHILSYVDAENISLNKNQ